MPNYYQLGQKHAAQALGAPMPQNRSYSKDFLAGVDPTGTYTTEFGMADVGTDTNSTARKMTGVAGGLLGGGLVIPSAISGLMEMPKGRGLAGKARAFGRGFIDPTRQIAHGFKAKGILKKAPHEGITSEEARFLLNKALSKTPTGFDSTNTGLRSRLMEEKARTGLTAREYNAIPEETVEGVNKYIGDQIKDNAVALGLGGSFSAGSAYAQYGKGRSMGQKVDKETRDKLIE